MATETGSAEAAAAAFHQNAVMYGFTNGKPLGCTIKNLLDFVQKNGNAPEMTTHTEVLAMTPTTAVMRIDREKDAIGANDNDYLTSITLDQAWQVIAKVYHRFAG